MAQLNRTERDSLDGRVAGKGHGVAHRRRHGASPGRCTAGADRLGAYRRLPLSRRSAPCSPERLVRRRRRGGSTDDAQCRRARSLHAGACGWSLSAPLWRGVMMDAISNLAVGRPGPARPIRPEHTGRAFGPARGMGESNAVAFCTRVGGAQRTLRRLLEICAALSGRAPETGLHLDDNRAPRSKSMPSRRSRWSARMPFGRCWRLVGRNCRRPDRGLHRPAASQSTRRLKRWVPQAASTGAVVLFHIAGVTPEDPKLAPGHERIPLHRGDAARRARPAVDGARRRRRPGRCRGVGSPHFSYEEFRRLLTHLKGRKLAIPF